MIISAKVAPLRFRSILAAAALLATTAALPGAADAKMVRAGGSYDGVWNVTFATTRGTCSSGFNLKAMGSPKQILPGAYAPIHAQTMVPASHLMWSGNWAGIAAGAVDRAKKFMRKAQRAGSLPPGVPHFTRALANLRAMKK